MYRMLKLGTYYRHYLIGVFLQIVRFGIPDFSQRFLVLELGR